MSAGALPSRSVATRSDEATGLADFDRLISTISHELQTPLSLIVGYAELLRTRDDIDTRRDAALGIQEAAERLSETVDDILTVAALDSGNVRLVLAPVELEEAVYASIRDVQSTCDHCSVVARSDAAEWPVVSADRVQLERILENLAANGCKNSPAGSEVSISANVRNGVAIVSVRDDGVGLTDVERARVFQRFSGIESPKRRGTRGSGLGLYIARALVELHGGTIWVESEPGRGSAFTFTLPLPRPDDYV